jgi:hypothetical protein
MTRTNIWHARQSLTVTLTVSGKRLRMIVSQSKLNLLCATWAAVVAIGELALARHDLTPGIEAPSGSGSYVLNSIKLKAGKKTLVMFVHPKCPCSIASLTELRQLMTQYGSQLNTTVLMFHSADPLDDWTRSATWIGAQQIPGVNVRADFDGKLAKQCGAQTSGQVFLYDENGTLRFEGGITGSRGHVGDNNSLDALVSVVTNKLPTQSAPARTPVFGCAIYSEALPLPGRN